jgi:hypothetical protein
MLPVAELAAVWLARSWGTVLVPPILLMDMNASVILVSPLRNSQVRQSKFLSSKCCAEERRGIHAVTDAGRQIPVGKTCLVTGADNT